MKENRLD